MSTAFAEFHDELRQVARGVLAAYDPLASGGGEPVPVDWGLVASSGWLGLEVPVELGGAGAGFAELAVVLSEAGRRAAPGPWLGTAVLGAKALVMAAPSKARDDLVSKVVAGTARLAVGLPGGAALPAPGFELIHSGTVSRGTVSGQATFVPDAAGADVLLLPTAEGSLAVVEAGARGLTVTPQPVVDRTRHLATVVAQAVPADDVWMLPPAGIAELADRAALAVACDSLGLAGAALEVTVVYVGQRQQFGRPVGSFQAVKHACADMLVAVTLAGELVGAAVQAVDGARPEAWVAVAMAASQVTASAVDVVGKAIQLHGGIGYTWDRGLHVLLKRALLNRSLFGSPAEHRSRLATRYRSAGRP